MTYLTDTSDNITLHFLNPSWNKSSGYIQPTTKAEKHQEKTKESVKHVTTRKIPNSKFIKNLTKPTTASTLHSTNGAWVPTPEQLGVNYEVYRRRKILIDDAANYKKPTFTKLRNEKKQEEIVQRLCRPTFSSSMHKTKKLEKLNVNSIIEAMKDINDKNQRKITVVNVGLPYPKQAESNIIRSFNPWIDESSLDFMKISDICESAIQGVNGIKKSGQINNTRIEKSLKETNRRDKLNINKIKECKKNKFKNILSTQVKSKLKEEISYDSKDSLTDTKLLNKPININLDLPDQASKKVMVPIKVKLINMDKVMHNTYKGKITRYEKLLNSMLAESLERFEFSFEKQQNM